VRDLKDELGVTVRLLKKAGERDFTEDGYTMHYVWFRAEVTSGTPHIRENAFDTIGTFSAEELE